MVAFERWCVGFLEKNGEKNMKAPMLAAVAVINATVDKALAIGHSPLSDNF